MTKKQKKQFAKKMAELELIVQKNSDPSAVNSAKDQILQLTESSDLDFGEMVEIDEMVMKILSEKI